MLLTRNVNVDDVIPFSIRDARRIVVLLDLANTAQGQLFKFYWKNTTFYPGDL